MRWGIVLATVWVLALGAWGQRYTFASYGQGEGLANLAVSAMAQDSEGFIWIATEDGLYRFESGRFRRYGREQGIGNGFNYSLHTDAGGRVWAGTDDGLYVGTGDSGRFSLVTMNGKGFPVGANSAFADLPDGHLLVLSNWRLLELSPQAGGGWRAQPFLAEHHLPAIGYVFGVAATPTGDIWVGCGSQLCEVSHGKLRKWGPAEGVPKGDWRQFLVARDGTLWVRDRDDILALAPDATKFALRDQGLPAFRGNDAYWVMEEDGKHRILTPMGVGLARWDRNHWEILSRAQGLPAFGLSALLEDRSGRLWMGVTGHGIERWLGYGAFSDWTTDEGLTSDLVWSVLQTSPRTVWVGTELGLDQIDPTTGKVTSWNNRIGKAGLSLHFIRQDPAGHVWFVNAIGYVTEYDPGTGAMKARGRVGGRIIDAFADTYGRVWIASNIGLFTVSHAQALAQVQDAGFDTAKFYGVEESPKGTLWASAVTGLFRQEGGHWHKINLGHFGLDPRFELMVPMSDGSVWAGDFTRGVDHLWLKGDTVSRVEMVDTPVLASEQTVFMGRGARGWLWVGNDHGVDVFDGKGWRRVDDNNGLIWNDTDNHAFDAAPDGTIWIGTSAGLSHIADTSGIFAPEGLQARITSLRFGSRNLLRDPGTIPARAQFAGDALEADFSALGAPSPANLEFRYRLEGLERDWSETRQGEARYPGLRSGHYTLQVVATDTAQHVESPMVSLVVDLAPPWWQSWPMELLWIAVFLALVWVAWRIRERALLRRQHVLEGLVADRTRALELMAAHDGLTQVWNRGAIFDRLSQELERCAREDGRIAVVLADLDHFKSVNDRLGHRRGDAVLQEAARRFNANLRPYDHVGRYGGEEFLLILPGMSRAEGEERLEQLRLAFAGAPLHLENGHTHELRLTCSLGVAWVRGIADMEAVLEQADRALYAAKAAGRNRVEYANEWR